MSRLGLLHNARNWAQITIVLNTPGTISGSGLVGVQLSVSPPTYTADGNPVNPTFTYAWRSNGSLISGATTSAYTPTSAQEGNTISCTVTTNLGSFTETTTISGPTVYQVVSGAMDPAPAAPSNMTASGRVTLPLNASNATIQGYPAGTNFWLPNGTYNNMKDIRPKQGMTFVGQSRTGVILDGTGEAYAFREKTNDVVIARMTIQNYDGFGDGETEKYRQNHAAIMPTSSPGYKGSDDTAKNWFIYQVDIKDCSNIGILMGHKFTISECNLYRMSPAGIGGDRFTGGNVHSCLLEENGIYGASGAAVNNAQIKMTWTNCGPFGQSDRDSSVWTSFTLFPPAGTLLPPQKESLETTKITNTTFTCNNKVRAIWFDLDCRDTEVSYCTINNSNSFGVFHEGSNYGLVHHNTFNNCGNAGAFNFSGGPSYSVAYFSYGAICSGSSDNIIVEDNTLNNCPVGIMFFIGERGRNGGDWTNGNGYPVADSAMRFMIRNTFSPAQIGERATTGASNCAARRNTYTGTTRYMGYLIQTTINASTEANIGTFVFEDNNYNSTQTTGSNFIWNKGAQTLAQWQSGGRN